MIFLALSLAFADEAPLDTHVVRRGDTLYGVAEQYGLDWRALAEFNNETARSLKPGDVLQLELTAPHDYTEWTVQRHQTLWGIAEVTGVSVAELKAANGLVGDDIRFGTVLELWRDGC